ncbi:Acetyltransferase, GNAT family [Fervidobacterium changbaicum]|uniref:GNAT family N-acetyltransferase n=2 Tax=Fervidobacterium TaxID=2422 RepID=A0AAI8CMF9_FERIS|nr:MULTISPECIES: GNAT family N-acetyltransferase [Fervidobacterium]AMW33168.1 GNAT family N-acetyltransferase [Fervidobacterium islandicum]QAV33229.1 N-acetyltransferase [Fervidobacterium changbaicum]SDH75862.1 Acetyltransferase, GNAT family [Fervidobacterium changbaicum]
MEVIRKAEISDADVIASLILETGRSFLPLLFGPYVKLILGRLVKTPGTVFSLDNTHVLEIDEGKVVGIIVMFEGNTVRKRALKTGFALFQLMGFELFRRLPMFRYVWMRNKIRPDEFYISNVAVDKNYRGRGYGRKLMLFAEEVAKQKKFKKISLDVENTNVQAIELYKRLGYVGTRVNRINLKNVRFTFIRMEKLLVETGS